MKWVGISGGWRKINPEIEKAVRSIVSSIIKRGNGIVSGGALNVDSIALDVALKTDPNAERIRIYLPTTLRRYIKHYRKHAKLGNITTKQAEDLIIQLTNLKKTNPKALIENPDANFTEENKKEKYYERNLKIVEASDELISFRIRTDTSEGLGTADTIEKAKKKGIPIQEHNYTLITNTKPGQKNTFQ